MKDRYSKLIRTIFLVGDLIFLNIAFCLASFTRFGNFFDVYYNRDSITDKYVFLIVIFNLIWLLVSYMLKIYEIYRVISLEKVIINLLKSVILHMLIVAIILVSLKEAQYMSRQFLLYSYLYFGILLIIIRLSSLVIMRVARAQGINTRNTVIIGANPIGFEIKKFIDENQEYGFNFLGFFDDNNSGEIENKIIGSIIEFDDYVKKNKVEEIFCALPLANTDEIRNLMIIADNNLARFKIVPDFRGFYNRKVALSFYEDIPVLLRRTEPLENLFSSFIKRTFDIIFSILVILFIMTWLTPIIGILIKSSSKGPVFFRQKRSGKVNREFWCWKFRTMTINNQADDLQASRNDSRITRVGHFLRRTSLDELPQFFNVLIGNMSVVGPRPHMLKHTEEYSKIIDRFMARHFIKPGITGLAQVRGYRGETKDSDQMYRRARTDVWYLENWSFLLDIKIIFLTVINGIKGDKMAY